MAMIWPSQMHHVVLSLRRPLRVTLSLSLLAATVHGLRFDPTQIRYNLNQNQQAANPLEYSGSRPGHVYQPSPDYWRFPFYSLFLDRFVNGDPSNDNSNGTSFEQDIFNTQFRHGGDIQGLIDSLDYIQGMGIKGIYIIGSPFINMPWGADSFSPLDLTLLDSHFGDIKAWQRAVDEIHARQMYIVLDHTLATLGDLIGFSGFLNESAPFRTEEHHVLWKTERRYNDFTFGNQYNESCEYPRFWDATGYLVGSNTTQLKGCYDSEFDQYGDMEAFGVHPDWQRQLGKFASTQDRLREWVPTVRQKLEVFSCLTIRMLDIDGFRYDKAAQMTVDAQGEFSSAIRKCAAGVGKHNFFISGEITAGNGLGSIYVGRGRQPDMKPPDLLTAMKLTTMSDGGYFIRGPGKNAIDAGAFHYSVYRFLTRFLGLSGNLEAGFDLPRDWVAAWNEMVLTNDMLNPNTGAFDPRHMLGVTNQDNFRWPAIRQGVERELLGLFITTLLMPGLPLIYYGQEQSLYILDNTAENYIFGRQPMSPALAWKLHGCYALSHSDGTYVNWPVEKARSGCTDDAVTLDHRDPAHPIRNILKSMFRMRTTYRTLNDGWLLQQLSNQTDLTVFEGSHNRPTERGIWSVVRAFFPGFQGYYASGTVWFVYHNREEQTTYTFDCADRDKSFLSPFDAGATVKNLFYPYDELVLGSSEVKLGFEGSENPSGCLSTITMEPFEFRAYVPSSRFVPPPPTITKFIPGHDAQLSSMDILGTVRISFQFSNIMDCNAVTASVSVSSAVEGGHGNARIDHSTIECKSWITEERPPYVGAIGALWSWSANLTALDDGIHAITVKSTAGTQTNDTFFLRVGRPDNPIVFPLSANYSKTLLSRDDDGTLFVSHKAAGANQWRYSLNWGSTWSNWTKYTGGRQRLEPQPWSGTSRQAWPGDHVIVQYWSKVLGSSSVVQHGDSSADQPSRRFPHMFSLGRFNQFGYDQGIRNTMTLTGDSRWEMHFMAEWPSTFQLGVWGTNPDGQPDATYILGDVDGDGVLDRLPPSSLSLNVLNATDGPPSPALGYRLVFNDADMTFEKYPSGNRWFQLLLYALLAAVPVFGAFLTVGIFVGAFYRIRINKHGLGKYYGISSPCRFVSFPFSRVARGLGRDPEGGKDKEKGVTSTVQKAKPRNVLIATIEHNIEDWNIRVKIGGLGVMAQLMSKTLDHHNLIWVVPCVGDIEYPVDQVAEPMVVTIMGKAYEVGVQHHQVDNVMYVLLDAPVFRKQSKTDPYPRRTDDIESAIYYSAWNSCIAETMRRFPIDVYHINDYHGAAAPLHLLPERTIPCALSLHNAEFQGMWSMRTPAESKEVCSVFNLSPEIVKEYVRFGSTFNLLHAAASYLRVHQRGFGAVGVSKKYGNRSYTRYPIFWGLSEIGHLPNPDPTDTVDWNKDQASGSQNLREDVSIDQEAEAKRGDVRKEAQAWAGLEQNPDADLFVFVGRWSLQKGVDLIADVFALILERYPNVQLICVGPVIDLYGRFAALKLGRLMERYPKRVYSKPEFTALPPCIFSGAEFALIPSRDEPFGLVAVEFGRKGALGIGARVGGLGQMPGWWYTTESMSPRHLLNQFQGAIISALETKKDKRAQMRAWSARQRFPVAQWLEDYEKLQTDVIRIHNKEAAKRCRKSTLGGDHCLPAMPTVSDLNLNLEGTEPVEPTTADPELHPGASSQPNGPYQMSSSRSTLALPQAATSQLQVGYPTHSRTTSAGASSESLAMSSTVGDNAPAQAARASTARTASYYLNEQPNSTPMTQSGPFYQNRNSSLLSIPDVIGERTDFKLQQTEAVFDDSKNEYYQAFQTKLQKLTPRNSVADLCIGEYLTKSEKDWFLRLRDVKLGRSREPTLTTPPASLKGARLRRRSMLNQVSTTTVPEEVPPSAPPSQAGQRVDWMSEYLGVGYKPPKGLKKMMLIRFFSWPVYTMLLALGQIMAVNSYQIVLLTGQIMPTENQLLLVCGIYGAATIFWWLLIRYFKSVYALSLPWFLYGLAVLLLNILPFTSDSGARSRIQDIVTGVYAAAAASGIMFFALNFSEEVGSPTSTWIFRSCIIQGLQQIYILSLWYWEFITRINLTTTTIGSATQTLRSTVSPVLLIPLALGLWTVGIVLFFGLPEYYRRSPETMPSFYASLGRRKTVLWFFLSVVLQNYWLSAPYGRNWLFLFSSQHVPSWVVLILASGFFAIIWALLLWALSFPSKTHPWFVPMIAFGLGAPRWAQVLWGTSGVGLYLPWAGGAVASALISRCLWLWLGVLDAIQSVGVGMALLLTLTRQHVTAALVGAQLLGSIVTIIAGLTAPDRMGPADVFPDFSEGLMPGISKVWFWIALALQLVIPVGFLKFFRKEQIAKP